MARSACLLRSLFLSAGLAVAGCELDTVGPIPAEPMTLVGADLQGRVYVIDEATGATTLVDTIFVDHPHPAVGAIPIGPVTSMVWIPTADMWWIGSSPEAPCSNCIYRFDPAADSARVIRRIVAETESIADFAVDPASGRVYTFKAHSSGYLFRVDIVSGWYDEVMRALDEGATGKGTTFWTDGLLYVSGGLVQQRLTRIDLLRYEAADVGPLTYVGFPPFASPAVTVQSMATRAPDGVVLALVQDGETSYLANLDPTNAVVVNVQATTTNLNALAYVPTRLLP